MKAQMLFAVLIVAARWTAAAGLEVVTVAPDVYAVVGDLGPQTYENGGLNANLGFVVGKEAVLVVNTGPSRLVAQALLEAIRAKTPKSVRWAVNVNSQSHYWWGNGAFVAHGATLLSHPNAARLMHEQGGMQREMLASLLKEKFAATEAVIPRELVADRRRIDLGGLIVEVIHLGPGHTPGELAVWIPQRKVLFAGDIVYTERLLAVLPISSTKDWLATFAKVEALDPQHIVPGHGGVTTLARARNDTRDYLQHLRSAAAKAVKAGIDPNEAARRIDQSRWRELVNFEALARRNASQVFVEVEKEEF